MRKIALVGMFVVLGAGCGRGWLPLFHGAPCRGCGVPSVVAPPLDTSAGCSGCAGSVTSSYGGYDGEVIGESVIGDSGYYGSQVLGESVISEGAIAPPMADVTTPAS